MRRFLNFLGAEDELDAQLDPDLLTSSDEGSHALPIDQSQVLVKDTPLLEDEDVGNNITSHSSLGIEAVDHEERVDERPGQPINIIETLQALDKDLNSASHARNDIDEVSPERKLRDQVSVLHAFVSGKHIRLPPYFATSDSTRDISLEDSIIFALRHLAETMVWADQNDVIIWDIFMEYAVMELLVECLHASKRAVQLVERDLASTTEANFRSEHGSDSIGKQNDVQMAEVSHIAQRDELKKNLESTNLDEQKSSPISRVPSDSDTKGHAVESSTSSGSVHPLSLQLTNLNSQDASGGSSGISDGNEGDTKESEGEPVVLVGVQLQILQTLSILVQSVSRRESLFCLFASNHINMVLSFPFYFKDEEMVALFLSALKSISLKLDSDLLQLFFNPEDNSFPLYTAVAKFYDHPESMVRIAVRNITLTIYSLHDVHVLDYVARDEVAYISNTVQLLAKLCGSVARAFELLLDDGREIRRTRRRTGIFRRNVRLPEVTAKLDEIESLCAYLGEVASVANFKLCAFVIEQVGLKLFGRFFRPIASQASPESIRQLHKWRLSNARSNVETKPALTRFDAAARCVLLAFFLTTCGTSPLGRSLVGSICRPTIEFEGRHVLHGLKAMISDIEGTERVTFIALFTIEALIRCDAVTARLLRVLKCDFGSKGSNQSFEDVSPVHEGSSLNIGLPSEDDLEYGGEESLLMSLKEFEIPLTPGTSFASSPSLQSMSPRHDTGYFTGRDGRLTSFDALSGAQLSPKSPNTDLSEDEKILVAFVMGEATLRECLSSLLLVVRRREVRSMRVLHTVGRIIKLIGVGNLTTCIAVTKAILDDLTKSIVSTLKDRATTIVSIEKMYENLRCVSTSRAFKEVTSIEKILCADEVAICVSQLPLGAGRRRGALMEKVELPVEEEDALAFMTTLDVYESLIEEKMEWKDEKRLSVGVRDTLTEIGADESYLEKRDALERVGEIVLKHQVLE